jgi:hypothetical protein
MSPTGHKAAAIDGNTYRWERIAEGWGDMTSQMPSYYFGLRRRSDADRPAAQ